MSSTLKLITVTIAVALLAACGAGLGHDKPAKENPPPSTGVSTTQDNFEAFALKDSYADPAWNLPTAGTVPTTGTHFIAYTTNGVTASPSTGPQDDANAMVNLSRALALPDRTRLDVERVLLNDRIYGRNNTHKQSWTYVGDDVVLASLADDGVTRLFAVTYDSWAAPVALKGAIRDATVMRSYFSFLQRTSDTGNFDFSKTWDSGSTYILRKGTRTDDTVFVLDSGAATFDANPSPVATSAATVAAFFNTSTSFTSNGRYTTDGVAYAIGDGSTKKIGSTDVWVANAARPTNADPSGGHAALFALDRKIYRGVFQAKGLRLKVLDQSDNTVVLDTSMQFNVKAAESIKAAVKF